MKALGIIFLLFMLVCGFFCVFLACGIGYDVTFHGPSNLAEVVCVWFMAAITLLIGLACFAVCPMIVNEM